MTNQPPFPTIHIISDSVGTTAKTVARSAASHFGELDPNFVVLPYVRSFDQIRAFLEKEQESHRKLYDDDKVLVFYTLVLEDLKDQLDAYLAEHPNIYAVDVLSDSIATIERMSGRPHNPNPGEQHKVNERYFERIEAIEFTVSHDDGLLTRDLSKADIVILGVSRTSKTPTSIYLGQQGYKVANVPIVDGIPLPDEMLRGRARAALRPDHRPFCAGRRAQDAHAHPAGACVEVRGHRLRHQGARSCAHHHARTRLRHHKYEGPGHRGDGAGDLAPLQCRVLAYPVSLAAVSPFLGRVAGHRRFK